MSEKLPTGKDKESRAARERLWRKADANGDGFLSLAEIDKALHDEQGFEQLFGAKPVLMRAFQSARQAVKSRDSRGDDYVEKAEFRQLRGSTISSSRVVHRAAQPAAQVGAEACHGTQARIARRAELPLQQLHIPGSGLGTQSFSKMSFRLCGEAGYCEYALQKCE